MSCLPCFGKKEEKKTPLTAGVNVPVHVEEVDIKPALRSRGPTSHELAQEVSFSTTNATLEAPPFTYSTLEEPALPPPVVDVAVEELARPTPVVDVKVEEPVQEPALPPPVVDVAVEELARPTPVVDVKVEEHVLAPVFVDFSAKIDGKAEERSLSFAEPGITVDVKLEESIRPSLGSNANTDAKLEVTTETMFNILQPIQPVEVPFTAPPEPQADFVCHVELPKAPPAVSVRPLHQAFIPEDHETLLMIAKPSLRDLIEANNEVSINGPSYTALLFARCVLLDDVAELSISLMQGARYPQVKVGPLRSSAGSKICVRAGLKYVDFGEVVAAPLKGDETARCVQYEGVPIMYIVRMGQLLTAVSPDGACMGKTLYMEDDELGPIMQILSQPNVDMLLVLVALLAAFLANSEICDDVLQSTSG